MGADIKAAYNSVAWIYWYQTVCVFSVMKTPADTSPLLATVPPQIVTEAFKIEKPVYAKALLAQFEEWAQKLTLVQGMQHSNENQVYDLHIGVECPDWKDIKPYRGELDGKNWTVFGG